MPSPAPWVWPCAAPDPSTRPQSQTVGCSTYRPTLPPAVLNAQSDTIYECSVLLNGKFVLRPGRLPPVEIPPVWAFPNLTAIRPADATESAQASCSIRFILPSTQVRNWLLRASKRQERGIVHLIQGGQHAQETVHQVTQSVESHLRIAES
jgi:hypothetical protein